MNDVRDMTGVFLEYGTTNIHPVAMVFMLIMAGVVIFSRSSRALLAVLLVCVFMPMMQRLVVAGLDFSMLRLILMLAWARVLVRGEYRGFQPTRIDWLFVLWTVSVSVIHVIRVGPDGIVYRLGTSFDAFTVYFLFRLLVRRREQVYLLCRQLAWITIVLGCFMAYELATRINVFSIFGSAPLVSIIRDGRVRCQGPFSHPILVGTFGGVIVPIFIALFKGRQADRKLMVAAFLFATITVVASGSSGPVITWGVGLLGWGLWRIRRFMRPIFWSLLGMALLIHLIRDKPVWHLIGRLAEVTGGTGYHRYLLIDAFMTRFGEWALVGSSDTAHWGWGLQDITNQYVAEGVNGGLLTLVLFLLLLQASFSRLRRSREAAERLESPKSFWALFVWGFSVSLAAHCVSFISVSYFGQMQQFFFMFLAWIPAIGRVRRRVPQTSADLRTRAARPVPRVSGVPTAARHA